MYGTAVGFFIFMIFFLVLIGIVLYGLMKFVNKDSRNYDDQFIWKPNMGEHYDENHHDHKQA